MHTAIPVLNANKNSCMRFQKITFQGIISPQFSNPSQIRELTSKTQLHCHHPQSYRIRISYLSNEFRYSEQWSRCTLGNIVSIVKQIRLLIRMKIILFEGQLQITYKWFHWEHSQTQLQGDGDIELPEPVSEVIVAQLIIE